MHGITVDIKNLKLEKVLCAMCEKKSKKVCIEVARVDGRG